MDIPPSVFDTLNVSEFFTTLPANTWLQQAAAKPAPAQLFSAFWMENEFGFLFADTNVGKSILAVQIAHAISSGQPVPGFTLQAPAQPVLYYDFEMNDKQFESRYSHPFTRHFTFKPHFIRVEIDYKGTLQHYPQDYNRRFFMDLESTIQDTGARVLIIDNFMSMRSALTKKVHALQLMQQLKIFKQVYNLSILVLAHTPKRNPCRPLSANDLQGHKTLINYADSAFALARSNSETDMVYIKQIKQRSTACLYGADNVCLCRVEKPDNFLQLTFTGYDSEEKHLQPYTPITKQQLYADVQQLLNTTPGLSGYAIAKQLYTAGRDFKAFENRVRRTIQALEKESKTSHHISLPTQAPPSTSTK